MVQLVVRSSFILMTGVVAALYAARTFNDSPTGFLLTMITAVIISVVIVLVDIFTPRKQLSAVSGLFLGLIVGMLAAYSLSFLVDYISSIFPEIPDILNEGIKVFLGVVCIFIAMTLILQTKDDFRFVIPYVELSKQIRGNRPMVLDSSAIIDGRILDITHTNILQGMIIIPRFILNELQTIADSPDKLKRARGRRGLDLVAKLQENPSLEVTVEDAISEGATVDQQLIAYADDLHARIITTDFNLAKVAKVRGVDVININELAEAMRPAVLPGESLRVQIVKPGESPEQGVGYLDDGTMIVVDDGYHHMNQNIEVTVTSVLQNASGRMIFCKIPQSDSAESA